MLTYKLIKKLTIKELKTIIHYYARDDDSLALSYKDNIILRVQLICKRILYDLNQYLYNKGITK